MLRVVLDTNVIVSAVVSAGKPRQLLEKGIDGRYMIVVSEFILKEVGTVLRRPKFRVSDDEVSKIILTLRLSGDVTTVTSHFKVVDEYPADDGPGSRQDSPAGIHARIQHENGCVEGVPQDEHGPVSPCTCGRV